MASLLHCPGAIRCSCVGRPVLGACATTHGRHYLLATACCSHWRDTASLTGRRSTTASLLGELWLKLETLTGCGKPRIQELECGVAFGYGARCGGRYLEEGLEYHLLVGVQHFFMVTNDCEPEEAAASRRVLEP